MIELKKEKYSILAALCLSVALVLFFHWSAINFGMGGYDLKFFVEAGDTSFSEVATSVTDFFHYQEFRPLNHYLFFLANRWLFGYDHQAMHIVLLLLNAFSAFLIYVLILLITEQRKTAFFTILVFLTRIAIFRSYYVLNFSPPKLCFFLLLTFISYILSRKNKTIFLPLSCFFFFLTMLTRETFILIPIGIFGYELVYHHKRKITIGNLKETIKRLYPFLGMIFGYVLIRIPYFWDKVSLQEKGMEISFRTLSPNHIFINLLTFARFNFNYLARYLSRISLANDWIGLIDVTLYVFVLTLGYTVYRLFSKKGTRFPDRLINNLIWGSFWFVLYVVLYCFFATFSPEYIYIALIGSSLVAASFAEFFYDLLNSGRSLLKKGAFTLLALHFVVAFYLLAQKTYKYDGLLKWWAISANYAAALERDRPPIPPGNRLHIYSPDNISKHVLGNKYRIDEPGGGYLFKYIYRNDDLKVIGYQAKPPRKKIKEGDAVFRLQWSGLTNETSQYR